MKNCLDCGLEVDDSVYACPNCGRQFAYIAGEQSQDASEQAYFQAAVRPDGSGAKAAGVIIGGLGIIVWLFSLFMSEKEYSFSDVDPDRLALKYSLSLIGGGMLSLGLIIWLAGYIVFAISFLPGKDDNAPDH
ncbi:MAG: hypothetical protein U1E68_00745 [Sphingomonadaceae bacterium]|jgi:DNA-directed RNA polymerase subunit RPC12/RpoP